MSTTSPASTAYAVVEHVYEDGRIKHERRVAVVPDYAAGAEKIAHLQKFRSVQAWRDVTYTLEALPG